MRRTVLGSLVTLAIAANVVLMVPLAGAMPPDHHTQTIFEHEHFSCANGVIR